jgi:hypothetical protein
MSQVEEFTVHLVQLPPLIACGGEVTRLQSLESKFPDAQTRVLLIF